MILDLEYPEFLPGGDYRIGFNVSRDVDGDTEFGDTTLATPEPPDTPASELAQAERLVNDDGALQRFVTRSLALGSTRELSCRVEELEGIVLEQVAPGLSALGATEQTSGAYVEARKAASDTYCGDGFGKQDFERAFSAATREAARQYLALINEIAGHLRTDPGIAAGLLESTLADLSANLTKNCSPDQGALEAFLQTGALPGLGDTRLGALQNSLFGTCGAGSGGIGGSVSANAQDMANRIASGKGLGGTFRGCINDVLDKELADSQCTNPRAQMPTPLEQETIDECMKRESNEAIEQCISEAQKKKEREMNPDDGKEEEPDDSVGYESCDGLEGMEQSICEGAKQRLDSPAMLSPSEILALRGTADSSGIVWGAIKKVVSWVVGPFKGTAPIDIAIKGGASALNGISKIDEAELRHNCDIYPTHEKCKGLHRLKEDHKRCVGEQFGDAFATYTTRSEAADFGTQPMTVFDRMNACYCDYLGQPVFGADCMSEEERQRQSCLDAPLGPDDGPRRECHKFMVSGDIEATVMQAAYCHYMMPDPNCTGVIGADGNCTCAEQVPPLKSTMPSVAKPAATSTAIHWPPRGPAPLQFSTFARVAANR